MKGGYDQSIYYTYDKLGQLIREDNPIKNKTYIIEKKRAKLAIAAALGIL